MLSGHIADLFNEAIRSFWQKVDNIFHLLLLVDIARVAFNLIYKAL